MALDLEELRLETENGGEVDLLSTGVNLLFDEQIIEALIIAELKKHADS